MRSLRVQNLSSPKKVIVPTFSANLALSGPKKSAFGRKKYVFMGGGGGLVGFGPESSAFCFFGLLKWSCKIIYCRQLLKRFLTES